MGYSSNSSEIDQMVLGWKSGTIEYLNKAGVLIKFKGKPKDLLIIFNEIRHDNQMKLVGSGLEKTFELKDVPEKIWRLLKKIKYIPTHIRSKRNVICRILKETCHFGPLDKKGDQ